MRLMKIIKRVSMAQEKGKPRLIPGHVDHMRSRKRGITAKKTE